MTRRQTGTASTIIIIVVIVVVTVVDRFEILLIHIWLLIHDVRGRRIRRRRSNNIVAIIIIDIDHVTT